MVIVSSLVHCLAVAPRKKSYKGSTLLVSTGELLISVSLSIILIDLKRKFAFWVIRYHFLDSKKREGI
jgi:hypothetical protein